MCVLDIAQNSFFSGEIDREATKVQTDAHLQKSHPGKSIPLNTTQAFLKIFWELIFSNFRAYLREIKFPLSKIYNLFVRFFMLLVAPAP